MKTHNIPLKTSHKLPYRASQPPKSVLKKTGARVLGYKTAKSVRFNPKTRNLVIPNRCWMSEVDLESLFYAKDDPSIMDDLLINLQNPSPSDTQENKKIYCTRGMEAYLDKNARVRKNQLYKLLVAQVKSEQAGGHQGSASPERLARVSMRLTVTSSTTALLRGLADEREAASLNDCSLVSSFAACNITPAASAARGSEGAKETPPSSPLQRRLAPYSKGHSLQAYQVFQKESLLAPHKVSKN